MRLKTVMFSLIVLAGCQGGHSDTPSSANASMDASTRPSSTDDSVDTAPSVAMISPIELTPDSLRPRAFLSRMSLDLRGRRPSIHELNRLEEEPDIINTFLEDFLHDEGFQNRVADDVARAMRSRFEAYPTPELDDSLHALYQASASQEITRLVRHIVSNDLPFSEILTADYTFVNEVLAEAFSLEDYNRQQGGWQQLAYEDGRPAAGVLSSNTFYLRYLTDGINYNRGRANAVSRIFLCDDYLKRPVDFPRNINLNDEAGVAHAIQDNPACISCHSTLDPLASYFSPFSEIEGDHIGFYDHDALDAWEETTKVPPAFNGVRGHSVEDLGFQLVADPRFARCIVKRTYESLLDRKATTVDIAAITAHTERFVASGMQLRVLYRSIVSDPVYAGSAEGQRPGLESKILSPEILSDALYALTGFRWVNEGSDVLRTEENGFRVLGGGVSSLSGDYPPRTANVSRVLVQNRVAEEAAFHAIFDAQSHREMLFGDLDLSEDSPSAGTVSRLGEMVWGRGLSNMEVNAFKMLFEALVSDGEEPMSAWAACLSVFLREPNFVLY